MTNMKLTKLIIFFTLLIIAVNGHRYNYENYQVVKVITENIQQVKFVNNLEKEDGIILLSNAKKVGHSIEIIIEPNKVRKVKLALKNIGLKLQVISYNAAKNLQKTFERLDAKKAFDLNDFNTYQDILTGLNQFVSNCPSGANCQLEDIGNSYLGDPLRVLKVTKPGANRKIVWTDSAIHAREWLAPATNLKIIDAIIKQEDNDAVALLNKYDFYFLVIMNPDGYQYTFSNMRFWRKNRSPNQGSSCVGTDLNRNYDANWMSDGTSTNPCSDTYGGSSAASESETKAIQNYARQIGNRIIIWTSIHTTAQMILTPYGHTTDGFTCVYPPDYNDILRVANAYADAIEETYGTSWERGSACSTIYPASGATMDYVYDFAGVKYPYTPELRGPGFDPPASQIQPSYDEVWNGLKAAINEIEAIGAQK